MRHKHLTIYIQTNSPGEVSHWVYAMCRAFRALDQAVEFVVFLTPCQYATGEEKRLLYTYPGVVKVYSPKETISFLVSLPFRASYLKENAFVLFLGGDPWYSRLLGWKLNCSVFGYTDRKEASWWGYKRLFNKYLDGDLMLSRVIYGDFQIPEAKRPYAVFLPGSRPQHFRYVAPAMDQIARHLKKYCPELSIKLLVSPFISQSLRDEIVPSLAHVDAVVGGDSMSFVKYASWMMSLPGTNTAEAMYLRTPMLVIIPLNRPEVLVFDGFWGLLGKLPLISWILNRGIVWILKHQKRFYALPNRMMQSEIVPEWVDVMDPEVFVDTVLVPMIDSGQFDSQRQILNEKISFGGGHPAEKISIEIFRLMGFKNS